MWDNREEFENNSIGAGALRKLKALSYENLLTTAPIILSALTIGKRKIQVGEETHYIFEFSDHSLLDYTFDEGGGVTITLGMWIAKGDSYPSWYSGVETEPNLRDLIQEQKKINAKRKDLN